MNHFLFKTIKVVQVQIITEPKILKKLISTLKMIMSNKKESTTLMFIIGLNFYGFSIKYARLSSRNLK